VAAREAEALDKPAISLANLSSFDVPRLSNMACSNGRYWHLADITAAPSHVLFCPYDTLPAFLHGT